MTTPTVNRMAEPLQIGSLTVHSRVLQSPLSGVTDMVFRRFDCRPDFLAAQKATAEGARTVDLNMGCPVNKITKKGGGSSLLRQPQLAAQIVQSVVKAVDVPVTVKLFLDQT